jgi:hypothetical protein
MSGKSPYASEAERKAAKAESGRRRNAEIYADPALRAAILERQFEQRAQQAEAREREKRMPLPVNATLYRQHGPFAPLFALQAAA